MNSYEKFIFKYKNQSMSRDTYTELHHIIPKYAGGDNSENNLIRLTYRQHILAHLLLYRRYGMREDITAYRLMCGLEQDRKIAIGKMIGEKHKTSGHIYRLGRHNVDSGFLESIKTFETRSKGGKIAGKIARETGQILSIRTEEGSRRGGKTSGKLATERGQIQNLGKYKGLYIMISPDGKEYHHAFQMSEELGISKDKLIDWCKNNRRGFSRRKKTKEELDTRWCL